MDAPRCGKCNGTMTPENARLRPELFLHDDCLPDEFRPKKQPAPYLITHLADRVAVYNSAGGVTHEWPEQSPRGDCWPTRGW